jgi:CBS domain-containing protein
VFGAHVGSLIAASPMGEADPPPGELSLFLHRVRDFIKHPLVSCSPKTSAIEVARLLSREGVGSVVVVGDDGGPVGIVTDRDLRRKVIAEGRDPGTTTAGDVMSTQLVTLRPGAFAFEAVLEMTRRRIRHVVVVDEGRTVGVVSSRDFLALHTTHPVTLAREITRAGSLETLAGLAARVTLLVRRLVEEGGTAHDIGQIVAELNDRMVVRVLALTVATLEEGGEEAPAVPYCWLALGSEARREQAVRSDQDNALVYADPSPPEGERAAGYYARFAEAAIQALVGIGFPACTGGFMASNPRWCQPASVWREYFRHWIQDASPVQVLPACIFFDLRPLAGAAELAASLRAVIRTEAPTRRAFLGLLAKDVVSRRLPLTLFGNVAVHRSGPHVGRVDIKSAGAIQMVGAGRLHALELGLDDTNTIDRIRTAGEQGLYRPDEVREIVDACQHLMRLRLVHQLGQLERGEPPDNYLQPDRLSRADGLLLRDALRTVGRVQAGIRERFATDALAAG